MLLRLLLAAALTAASFPAQAGHEAHENPAPEASASPLSPPDVPGLAFPSGEAVRAAAGDAAFTEYQRDLGEAAASPRSPAFQRAARALAKKWSDRLFEASFPDPAERTLMEYLARGSGGLDGARRELTLAANAGRAETFIQDWRARTLPLARALLLRAPDAETRRLREWLGPRAREDKVFSFYCSRSSPDFSLGAAPAGAREQAERIAAQAPGASSSGFDSAPSGAAEASDREQLETQCSNWRKKQEWSKPGQTALDASGRPVPGPQTGAVKPPDPWVQNLKRDAIAGAFGAAAFGLIGFVFGGPPGAALGALAGFAVMAAVTHLAANPIK